jgi:hypothetical protein
MIDGKYNYNYTNNTLVQHKDVFNTVILLVCVRSIINEGIADTICCDSAQHVTEEDIFNLLSISKKN